MPNNSGNNASSGKRNVIALPSTNNSSNTSPGEKSLNQMAKDGWGSRTNFHHSIGLKMDPDSIAEGNQILESFRAQDREQAARK